MVTNVSDSNFTNLYALYGGSIYAQGTSASVMGSIFNNSKSSEIGGALVLSSLNFDNRKTLSFFVGNNLFYNCSASIKGGAVFYDMYRPESLLNNLFSNNNAAYGQNYASYPTMLTILNSSTQWSSPLVSGQIVDDDLVIGLLD